MRRMSSKDLQEKYGKPNTKAAINAAIRAELAGGNEALEALELAHKSAHHKDDPEAAAIGRCLTAIHAIVDAMAVEIRRRYDLPG